MNNPTTPTVESQIAGFVSRAANAVANGAPMGLALQRVEKDLRGLGVGITEDVRQAAYMRVNDEALALLIAKPRVTKLVAKWGCVGAAHEEVFHSYPEDGKCSCGVFKHHVHCTCGGITQVG